MEEGEAKLKALEEKMKIAKKVYEEYACYGTLRTY
jgi:hypothetical protein